MGRWRRGLSKKRPRHKIGQMNLTEKAYLEVLKAREDVHDVLYESVTFKLADNCRYTPDFLVQLVDGSVEFHEVKAASASGAILAEDDAKVKIKVAAEKFGLWRFLIAARLPKKSGGGWRFVFFNEEDNE